MNAFLSVGLKYVGVTKLSPLTDRELKKMDFIQTGLILKVNTPVVGVKGVHKIRGSAIRGVARYSDLVLWRSYV